MGLYKQQTPKEGSINSTDYLLYIYGSCIEDDRNGRTIPNSLVVVLLPKSFEKEGREGLRMWTLSTKCIWFSLWSKLFLLRLPTGTKSSFPSSLNHSLEIEAIFVQSRPRHTVLTAESFTSHHYYDDYQWASLLTWHLAGQPHLLLRHDLCSRTGGQLDEPSTKRRTLTLHVAQQ